MKTKNKNNMKTEIKKDPLNVGRLPFNYENIIFNDKIGEAYETKEYNKFNLVNVNRDVDRTTKIYKELKEAIATQGYMLTSGVVDKYGNVADGQHRLAICMELKIPFQYSLIEKATLDLIKKLNNNRKKWKHMTTVETKIKILNKQLKINKINKK